MKDIHIVYKKEAETPLQTLIRFRQTEQIPQAVPLTYAGRLDPLAEGVLVVLSGEAVHEKDLVNKLDKEYEAEFLIGIKTDTYDLLGIPKEINTTPPTIESAVEKINSLVGCHYFPYPPYSSKPIHGKPLFMWAREGKINDIVMPTTIMQVNDCTILSISNRSGREIKERVNKITTMLQGDFRQYEINDIWKASLRDNDIFLSITIRWDVASGTYIRSLADYCGATLYRLKRMRVGGYTI